jgi:hypothetical protein
MLANPPNRGPLPNISPTQNTFHFFRHYLVSARPSVENSDLFIEIGTGRKIKRLRHNVLNLVGISRVSRCAFSIMNGHVKVIIYIYILMAFEKGRKNETECRNMYGKKLKY